MICVLSVIYCAVWVAVSATGLAVLLCQFLVRGCNFMCLLSDEPLVDEILQKSRKSAIIINRENNTADCVK